MKIAEKTAAINLRMKGQSLKEIARVLHVSKASVSVWVRGVTLSEKASARIHSKLRAGQLVALERNREIYRNRETLLKARAEKVVASATFSSNAELVVLALLYWCEGSKDPGYGVHFTNSDPKLMLTFLRLLRKSYTIDESRLHPCLHIHDYHNANKQLAFWSKVTNIPIHQFTKPYRKPNTKKRVREGYQGCVGLKYYDSRISRELVAIAIEYLGV